MFFRVDEVPLFRRHLRFRLAVLHRTGRPLLQTLMTHLREPNLPETIALLEQAWSANDEDSEDVT